ncbi:GntR family transcriptional regulator [Clostridiaceae bacterium UIB06]|uniref:GntR family transcriptional regulator n=1 Tax=Clostridium thailandense TaxID=2794346 RepID=A0A949U0W2_9CLOT|nr:GntR family transcriptional regulator [Clostridium thailandense]MBV7275386.1 GntR family transcriptional regulator [Clostridium thailandense]MCH5136100.1 GntR family transcriptional regulator [Clostridiaceae bacterium UIB06]
MNQNVLPPMYLQVKNFLIEKIENNVYKEQEKLPSERELSEKFQISRMTARNAITELVNEGYAYRDGVRGTFVSKKKVKRNFVTLDGFSRYLKQSGVTDVKTKVVEFSYIEADSWLSSKLNVPIGSGCYKLIRVRIGNDEPMAVEHTFINGAFTEGLLQYDFSKESLYHILDTKYSCMPKRSVNTLEMCYFNNFDANLLRVKSGTAGFITKGKSYDESNNLIEYVEIYNRGDLFKFTYELRR